MSILPERAEADALVPPREGVTWRVAGDLRLFGASGYALLLQVAHPSVGAGVSQFSNFKQDPWGRLLRTLDYTTSSIYGGPGLAWEVGRRVRNMHKQIKGVRPDGERYHALEPEPYAWVHATLAESIVKSNRLFCSPRLTPAETEEFWREWRRLGRLIGVRYRDLPETWDGLLAYFDEFVERELRRTEAVDDVLASLTDPTNPMPWPATNGLWKVLRWPSTKAEELATVGMLPPVLRERFGVEWSARDERRFRRLGAVSRRARPLMPPQARSFGPTYLRWRREAIARGDVAAAGAEERTHAGSGAAAPA